jgi:hypothetical protein
MVSGGISSASGTRWLNGTPSISRMRARKRTISAGTTPSGAMPSSTPSSRGTWAMVVAIVLSAACIASR